MTTFGGSLFALDLSMSDFAHHLMRLLQTYTYPVLVGLVLLESLGIPLPGEIALVTAAAYASLGHISIYAVIILAALGAIVGGALGYLIGLRGGLPLVLHYGGFIWGRKKDGDRAPPLFSEDGAETELLRRVIAPPPPPAGVVAGGGGQCVFSVPLLHT